MKYRSVFDIIGPIMVGPSSSHTAGAARIGLFTRNLFGKEPKNVEITLYGSFKDTYRGHGTDIALIGGLLGCDTFDKGIRTSLEDATEKGISYRFIESEIAHIHPNTAKLEIEGDGRYLEVIGKSIGGGKMVIFEIQGFDVDISADFFTLLVFYKDSEASKAILLTELEKFNDYISKYRFSTSVIEGKGLLTIEIINNEEVIQNYFENLECVVSTSYAQSI